MFYCFLLHFDQSLAPRLHYLLLHRPMIALLVIILGLHSTFIQLYSGYYSETLHVLQALLGYGSSMPQTVRATCNGIRW